VILSTGVLPDGRQTSATNVLASQGKDRFTWKSLLARVGGEPGPDVELQFVRKPAQ
jgi:hypothetical protein